MTVTIRLFAVLGMVFALTACADLSRVSQDGEPFTHGDPYGPQIGSTNPRSGR